jgi:tRNA 2-thiouridine synthesizing protein A
MDTNKASGNQVDETLDARGLFCPMPIIKINQIIKKMQINQTVKVLATDPGSKKDVASWCNKTGNKLLQSSEENGVFTYVIKKLV